MAVKRNLIANYVGQAWAALMNIIFVPVYVYYLGIESYALIGIFSMVLVWLRLLDMGMTPTLVREFSRFTGGDHDTGFIRDLLRTCELTVGAISIIVTSVAALTSSWLAKSWLQTELAPGVVAAAILMIVIVACMRFFEGLYRSCLVGLQDQVRLNGVVCLIASLRGVGAIIVLHWISPTIGAFFIWQGIVSIISATLLARLSYASLPKSRRSARFSGSAIREIRSFAVGVMGTNLLAVMLTQIDKLLLTKLLSLSDFGHYAIAAAVAGAVFTLATPIIQAWYPRMSQLHASENTRSLVDYYHLGSQFLTVMLGSSALVLALFAEPFLLLWTQDETLAQATAPLLTLLTIGNLLNGLLWMPYQAQLVYGWTSLAVWINGAAVVVVIPAIFLVTPVYGGIGAATVWLALNAVYLILGMHIMYRRILTGEKWKWYAEDVLVPLLSAAFTVGLIRWFFPGSSADLGQFLVLVFAGTMTLLVAAVTAPRVRTQAICIFAGWVQGHRLTRSAQQ